LTFFICHAAAAAAAGVVARAATGQEERAVDPDVLRIVEVSGGGVCPPINVAPSAGAGRAAVRRPSTSVRPRGRPRRQQRLTDKQPNHPSSSSVLPLRPTTAEYQNIHDVAAPRRADK